MLTAVVLQAQDQPTFRTGANYVRVDMYASVDGKSIEDLTAEEVEVLEDGVPQKLEGFEHVQVRPAGPQESRREPNTVEQSRQMAAEGRARVFVIFLDTYHTHHRRLRPTCGCRSSSSSIVCWDRMTWSR